MTTSDRCPKCRHAEHDGYRCLNMASDNDCACDLRPLADHDELLTELHESATNYRDFFKDADAADLVLRAEVALRDSQRARQTARAISQARRERAETAEAERDALQQRIDAAKKMLLSIIDGLSYVDDKTDPVAIANTTLDEIKVVRATLTALTESKEPDHEQ